MRCLSWPRVKHSLIIDPTQLQEGESMPETNVYEQLADMLVCAPTGAPAMKTPELIQILRLQYTSREARLAVQVGLLPAKLDEIAEKTGIEKGKLEKTTLN